MDKNFKHLMPISILFMHCIVIPYTIFQKYNPLYFIQQNIKKTQKKNQNIGSYVRALLVAVSNIAMKLNYKMQS